MLKIFFMCFLFLFEFSLMTINGFNISPKPSKIFKEPGGYKVHTKERSSYFGFSINLRKSSIFVGAPRAQSSLKSQSNTIEPGAIYKCELTHSKCSPYVFDEFGNTLINDTYTINSEIKDSQWLGTVIDGFSNDNDELITCAAKRMMKLSKDYSINGICYSTQDVSYSSPVNIETFTREMKNPSKQMINTKHYSLFNYKLGQQGFSIHLTDNKKEIILGAPGVYQWRGAMIRKRKTNILKKYEITITDPTYKNEYTNFYFGYAVSSGNFLGENDDDLLYVASAPSHNTKAGEAYLFNIVNNGENDYVYTHIHKVFKGLQLGDYFGYAILTEDFNNDGIPDLAISAPMHSKNTDYDNGVVYIFINKKKYNFALQGILSSDYKLTSRFGTALGRIGDLNLDGYNDIAIGAPFEENGVVYIYFGEPNGVSSKPMQRLSPNINEFTYPGKMFGHAISRGVDVDENGYLDLAIGSPEDDTVYLYKTYPIVKIIASIQPARTLILPGNTDMKIKFCWYLDSKTDLKDNIDMNLIIKLDVELNRVRANGTNILYKERVATLYSNCMDLDVTIHYIPSHIFKPIIIELHYNIIDKIANSSDFCNTCVMTNPQDNKMVKSQIVFISGCDNSICIADLKLSSKLINKTEPLILGETKSITVEYTIKNNGQPAFLPQINITYSQQLTPMKLPSNCDLLNNFFICTYNPLNIDGTSKLEIKFDTSEWQTTKLILFASVTTISLENNKNDNNDTLTIIFNEYSEIDILSKSITKTQNLIDKSLPVENISYVYEIINKGPSNLYDFCVQISVPIVYTDLKTKEMHNLIKFEDLIVFANYHERKFKPKSLRNKFDIEESNSFSEINHKRLLRSIPNDLDMIENQTKSTVQKSTFIDPIDLNKVKINYPISKTIFFNCENDVDNLCVNVLFEFNDLVIEKDNFISISVFLLINMTKVDNIINAEKHIFILSTGIQVYKINEADRKSLKILTTVPYTEIQKISSISLWIYIIAVIGGLLLLIFITYGLHKFGFFKRAKKEEMKKLVEVEKEKASARAKAIENSNDEMQ